MRTKKIKIVYFLLGIILVGVDIYGSKLLKNIITEGKWAELPAIFKDDTYQTLEKYFAAVRSIKIITSEANQLTYKAKFSHQGEIGVITFDFQEKEGQYSNVKIKNQIQPLYFIEKFKIYKADNIKVSVGDAQLHFISGYFYETLPFPSLLLFKGKWQFYIKPGDREEQLTLNRMYKKDYFSQSAKTGILVLPERDFLNTLAIAGEVKTLDKECQSLYNMYRGAYGIKIKQFDEYWYLPFPKETHLVIFSKDKGSFYYYSFNPGASPDTRLLESKNNDMILSYNAEKGLKLSFGGDPQVSEMKLNIYFNPNDNFISGTTTITYKEPTSLKVLGMADGLRLMGTLNLDSKGMNVFRKRDTYYLLGPEANSLSLYFRGRITPNIENFELFKLPGEAGPIPVPGETFDSIYFLSRSQNYYPNPGDDFFKTQVTVTLPGGLNCLASGNLVEKSDQEPVSFKFNSIDTKGISLVTGNFSLSRQLETRTPLYLYTFMENRIPRGLDLEEIKEGFDFFIQCFGPLDSPWINILLRRGADEGGVSFNGTIVVNFYEKMREGNPVASRGLKPDKKMLSPILIRDHPEDYILHELAHQWWGGVISWKSYQDNWITEGLSHFSVLYFLKKKLPEKQFHRIIKRLKRWVYRFSDSGPIIYGTRIRALEKLIEPYQSVIYNKSALLFLMALEWLGEQEFNRRLKGVLEEFKYRSITTMQFLRQFCGSDTELFEFLRKWLYSRTLPEVELRLVENDPDYDLKEFKRVVLTLIQSDSDFIFPLRLKVTTQKGSRSIESMVIKEKEQKIIVTRDTPIRAIDIEDWFTPLKEKKQPQPRR